MFLEIQYLIHTWFSSSRLICMHVSIQTIEITISELFRNNCVTLQVGVIIPGHFRNPGIPGLMGHNPGISRNPGIGEL